MSKGDLKVHPHNGTLPPTRPHLLILSRPSGVVFFQSTTDSDRTLLRLNTGEADKHREMSPASCPGQHREDVSQILDVINLRYPENLGIGDSLEFAGEIFRWVVVSAH